MRKRYIELLNNGVFIMSQEVGHDIEIDLSSKDLLLIARASLDEHHVSTISKTFVENLSEDDNHEVILRELGRAYMNEFLIKAVEHQFKNSKNQSIDNYKEKSRRNGG